MSLWPDALTWEVVGASLCGGCSLLLYKTLCSQQSTIEAMQAAPALRSENIVNQTGQVMLAGMTGFMHGTVSPVQGQGIRPSAPIAANTMASKPADTSLGSGSTDVVGVVSQRTITEMIMTQVFGIWSSNERIINVECEAIPFHIVDGNLRVQVQYPLELDSIQLQTVGESYEAPTGGFFTSLMAALQGFHTTGIKHTQEMLVSGTEVVGLGRLVLKSSGFYLEPDATLPYIVSSHSRQAIIQSYSNWIPYLRVGYWLLGSLTTIFIGRLLHRHLRKAWADWRNSTTNRAYQLALTAAADCDSDDLPSKLSCIICCGLRNAVLVPCAHVAVCLKCVDKLKHCPLCRAGIASVQPLIYS